MMKKMMKKTRPRDEKNKERENVINSVILLKNLLIIKINLKEDVEGN